MIERRIIPAAGGTGFRLARGEQVRIIDIEGGQSGDLVAFSADGSERLSNGRTFDYNRKIEISTGDVLWSDRSNPLLTIVADEVGRHDLLYAPCSPEMYRIEYNLTDDPPNCLDNLTSALRGLGIDPTPLTATFNFFMCVHVGEGGRLSIAPPCSKQGDSIVLRAEMDLVVALSACPASTCNGGMPPRPLAYEIIGAGVSETPC